MPILLLIVVALIVAIIASWAYIVPQQVVYIIESLGRFSRADGAGMHFKVPFFDRVAGKLSLRIQQLDNRITTKTKDNVFVTATVSVQYQVNANKVADAFYRLENPEQQINAYVEDAIRSAIPKLDLDDAYVRKDDVAEDVQSSLESEMDSYGYIIVKTLITSIEPDKSIREAMNSINEANRRREAAKAQAEADKIAVVTRAEAEAEEMRLRGEGVANQRKAIVEGLSESVRELAETGLDEQQIMSVLLTNQYIDTLNKFAESDGHTIFLPASMTGVEDVRTQIMSAIEASKGTRATVRPTGRAEVPANTARIGGLPPRPQSQRS